ncbi:MAG: hypothetical protein H0V54_06865 [Chthoniobacterales bacterium]|nr:hypothetical protein [Chthoniobacterales bacterium]
MNKKQKGFGADTRAAHLGLRPLPGIERLLVFPSWAEFLRWIFPRANEQTGSFSGSLAKRLIGPQPTFLLAFSVI